MSLPRADFWNLAGISAVEFSIEFNNDNCEGPGCQISQVDIDFVYGRQESFTLVPPVNFPVKV